MFSRNRLLLIFLTVTILSVNLYFLVQFRSTFNADPIVANAINEKLIIGQFTKMLKNRSHVLDLFTTTTTTSSQRTTTTDSAQSGLDTADDFVTKSSSLVKQSLTYEPNYHSTLMTINEAHDNVSLNTFHLFKFIINPEFKICGRKRNETNSPTLIAFVPISVSNFRGRLAIRHTWSNYNLFNGLRVVFLTGLSPSDKVNKNLRIESEIYGDIVQADFADTYRNLTIKTMMGLKWVSQYCNNTRFVLKVDDDVVVNTHFLLKYLKGLARANSQLSHSLICRIVKYPIVIRNESSKFYIRYDEYSEKFYPRYCDGPAYMMTTDLAGKFYHKSFGVRSFVFEDVYVGMLAHELNASFINMTQFYINRKKYPAPINKTIDAFHFIYVNNLEQFYQMWNYVYDHFIKFFIKIFFIF